MTLTLIGKPDCHLCHEMEEVVRRVVGGRVPLTNADVRSKPDWYERYRYEIPVLLCDGQEIARHRVTDEELRERLAAAGAGL